MNFSGLTGLFMMVRRSLKQHAFSTIVTAISMALGCGLVMAVFNISAQSHRAFTGGKIGYDAVLGARGSKLQLVLNTVFHLETSPGNIPWKLYQEVKANPAVKLAIPYAVGDNYKGYRIVGTNQEIFTKFEYEAGKQYTMQAGGRPFDPNLREAVIGSFVARKTGLRLGSKFNPYHGVVYNKAMKHQEEYIVVGVMKPTNSPADRVIWIPIEGIFRMEGHYLRGDGELYKPDSQHEIPDKHKEVSAVMLKFQSKTLGMQLDQMINRQGKVATLAWPIGQTMAELFDKLGWMNRILGLVAYLVIFVAAASMLASIYNTMNERRREMAILRALGARRTTLFAAIVLESSSIALLGSLLGYVIYAIILLAAAAVIRDQTGVVLEIWNGHWSLWVTPPMSLVIGAFSGLIPAFKAYGTDVASNLVPTT